MVASSNSFTSNGAEVWHSVAEGEEKKRKLCLGTVKITYCERHKQKEKLFNII